MGDYQHPYYGQSDIYYPNGQQVYPTEQRGKTWDMMFLPLEQTQMFAEPAGWTLEDEREYQEYLRTFYNV